MSYYGYQTPRRDKGADDEKAWKRAAAVAWDEKWHALSTKARHAYLSQIKAPSQPGSGQTSSPATGIDRPVLDELVAAGFIRLDTATGKKPHRVYPTAEAYDFSARLRAIHRHHLLVGKPDLAGLARYVAYTFYDRGEPTINRVLTKAKVEDYPRLEAGLESYVTSGRWPAWAVADVKSPAASPMIEALAKADGPVPLSGLAGLLPRAKPADVRSALDGLIARLAVFEDVDPKSLDLVVGLLPSVRERMAGLGKPRARPPLVVGVDPKQYGPTSGLAVNDLRVFLLEVAGQPPKLRQDGGLFVKEEPRFLEAMPEWPEWVYEASNTEPEDRVEDAFDRARFFKFTEREDDERRSLLKVSGKGRAWLALGLDEQYDALYKALGEIKKRDPRAFDDYDYDRPGDSKFYGVDASATPASDKGAAPSPYYGYREVKPEHRQALREATFRALAGLGVGVYYRLLSVLDHLAFGEHNPLLAGQKPESVSITLEGRAVPRLPERQEQAGQHFLSLFLARRLLPLDAFRMALDVEGFVCIARNRRLDGYFGRPYEKDEADGSAATRVIVQPDFSVIVIGLNPAPAVELAPFCERATGQVGQGALTFKITRASVVRAATQGLSASQIVARLKKHASIEVPENVLREVQDWAGWIRLVNVKPMTVVRCPDRATADRVASALGRRAERIAEAMVALDSSKVTPAERLKLQEAGVIITEDDITADREPVPEAMPEPPMPTIPAKRPRGRPKKIR